MKEKIKTEKYDKHINPTRKEYPTIQINDSRSEMSELESRDLISKEILKVLKQMREPKQKKSHKNIKEYIKKM